MMMSEVELCLKPSYQNIKEYLYYNDIFKRLPLQDINLGRSSSPPALVGGAVVLHGIVHEDNSVSDRSVWIQYPHRHFGFKCKDYVPMEEFKDIPSLGQNEKDGGYNVTYALPLYLYRRDIPFDLQHFSMLRHNDALNVQGEEPFFIALCDVYKEEEKGFRFEIVPESLALCVFVPHIWGRDFKPGVFWGSLPLTGLTLALLGEDFHQGRSFHHGLTDPPEISMFSLRYYRNGNNEEGFENIKSQFFALLGSICRMRAEYYSSINYTRGDVPAAFSKLSGGKLLYPVYIRTKELETKKKEFIFLGYWSNSLKQIFLCEENVKRFKILELLSLVKKKSGPVWVEIIPQVNDLPYCIHDVIEENRHRLVDTVKVIKL